MERRSRERAREIRGWRNVNSPPTGVSPPPALPSPPDCRLQPACSRLAGRLYSGCQPPARRRLQSYVRTSSVYVILPGFLQGGRNRSGGGPPRDRRACVHRTLAILPSAERARSLVSRTHTHSSQSSTARCKYSLPTLYIPPTRFIKTIVILLDHVS